MCFDRSGAEGKTNIIKGATAGSDRGERCLVGLGGRREGGKRSAAQRSGLAAEGIALGVFAHEKRRWQEAGQRHKGNDFFWVDLSLIGALVD